MTTNVISSVIEWSSTYQITYSNGLVAFVPKKAENQDYVHLQSWIAAGGMVTQGVVPTS